MSVYTYAQGKAIEYGLAYGSPDASTYSLAFLAVTEQLVEDSRGSEAAKESPKNADHIAVVGVCLQGLLGGLLASLQKPPKNLPRSLRFRALKTVRGQNWWAA